MKEIEKEIEKVLQKNSTFNACTNLVKELEILYEGWEGVKQLKGTPQRLTSMYQEFCWTPTRIKEELEKQFQTYENGYDEMLVSGPTKVWTLCPHHLLPVELKVVIGYVPNGKVLGLSKFSRVAIIMGKRPIMQEQYSMELANALDSGLQPKGVAVYITGRHGCMSSRGVTQDTPVVTSIVKGVFLNESSTREEFYAIARDCK